MNRECQSAKKCEICGFEVKGRSNVRHHVRNVHKISMEEYRTKYGVPQLTTAKFTNTETEVTCCICGARRMRPTHLVEAYKARGIVDHTCGKPECAKKLRAIKVKAARTTEQSRANTSVASKVAWAKNHDAHAAACLSGMKASPNYRQEVRVPKMLETRRINKIIEPDKYSNAIKQSWKSRPHQIITSVDFECAHCHAQIHRELKPDNYTRFLKSELHFCNDKCHGQYKHTHTAMATRACSQCGKPITRRKALIEYQERKGKTRFFCCNTCQRVYQDAHAKTADTVPELVVKSFLKEHGLEIQQHNIIMFVSPIMRQRWTIPDFTIRKLLIYVDGCYFHGCKQCGFPGIKDNAVKDPLITAALTAMGYRVLRIWEHELKASAWQSKLLSAAGR